MNQKDEIQKLQESTLQMHKLEDGILDMTIGFILTIFGLGFLSNNTAVLWLLVYSFVLLSRKMKRKYVYPRVGIAVFAEKEKQARPYRILLIAGILGLGLIGYTFFSRGRSELDIMHPIFNTSGILIAGVVMLGGLFRKQLFYLAGLALMIPLIVVQFTKDYWIGVSMAIAASIILLILLMWMSKKNKADKADNTISRPGAVIHSYLMLGGLLCFIYFLLACLQPVYAANIRHWGIINHVLIFSNMVALVILGIGLAYRAPRFYLYAVLLSASVLISRNAQASVIHTRTIFTSVGLLLLVTGTALFFRFLKKYHVLEENEDEPGEN